MKMMRYFYLAVLLAVIAVIAMAGSRGHRFTKPPFEIFPDMNYQPKIKDQQASAFFSDGMASRQPVAGTVAEEMPATLDYWATGKFDASHWGDGIPVHPALFSYHDRLQRMNDKADEPALAVDDENMARGRERYQINCAVCHGASGDGKGITSQYGINATSYQSDRLRTMNDGEIFNTITNGKGQMMGYGYNIAIDDRWRIIMYIRALQHAQNASVQDASPADQQQLNAPKKSAQNNQRFQFDVGYPIDSSEPSTIGPRIGYLPQLAVPKKTAQNNVPFRFDLGFSIDSWEPIALGPLRLDYGMQFNVPKKAANPKPLDFRPYQIKYLDQKTAVGWYEGGLSEQF